MKPIMTLAPLMSLNFEIHFFEFLWEIQLFLQNWCFFQENIYILSF